MAMLAVEASLRESARRDGRRSRKQPDKLIAVFSGESSCLDLEGIVPVAKPQAGNQVAPDRQAPRTPLMNDVKEFMEEQFRVLPEIDGGAGKQDGLATGRCPGAQMKTGVQGFVEDPDVANFLPQCEFQCPGDCWRN